MSIIATSSDGLIKLFNRGAEQLLGYTADDVVGKFTPALFHLEEEVQTRGVELSEEYGSAVAGFRVFVHKPESEGAETREWTYVHKDGHHIPVSLVVTAMRDESAQITGYLGIAITIAERKAALQALAVSLETTRAVLDTAVNPIITIDASGLVLSINPAGLRAFGYKAEEILGQNINLVMPAPYHDEHDAYLERYLRKDKPRVIGVGREVTARRKDGSVFPVHLSVGAMTVSGQRRFVGILTDITEQQRQRLELTSARDQLVLAADAAELGVWTRHLSSDTVELNERMLELYGLDKALMGTVIHRSVCLARIHPDDLVEMENSMQSLIESGQKYAPVFRVVHPTGRVVHIQAGAQVERNDKGTPVRVTGINRDITAQRELEARLLNAKEQADAASAAKSSFLANMSHEIRTPLNAVLGMLQLVQQTPLESRQHDYVTKAHMAATSLLSLLNDILDYSKIEAGKLALEVYPFEVEAQMNELAVVLSGNQGGKAVELIFDIDPALPPVLVGDSLRLKQILINLAGNALKFTQSGQVVVGLKVLHREGSLVHVEVAVSDTGIGIRPELLERIFDGFTQAEASTSRRFGGTGLGLVICRRLVALMGGTLRVESEVDVGSRFWFDVRLEVAHASPLQSANTVVPSGLRVLLAEDNNVAASLMLNTMRALGWQPQHVTDGLLALQSVRQANARNEPFDLLIFDWRMPNLDGLSAARRLHEESSLHRPVIVMITAHGREVLADARNVENAPFVGFLTKPVTAKQLADAAQQAMSKTQSVTSLRHSRAVRAQRLRGLRLLVVEDNALNRQVAAELLGAEGAYVQLAEGGLEGVARAVNAPSPFDVVLMDVQMPDIDGLEATRRIRLHRGFAALPIVAMTANASRSDRDLCLAAGMNDHVGKPIDLDRVVSTILALSSRAPQAGYADRSAQASALIEDREAILRRLGNDEELFAHALATFEVEEPKALKKLQTQLDGNDVAGALATLHGIKGSAGTMGAAALALCAGTMERALKTQAELDGAVVAGLLNELYRSFSDFLERLRELTAKPLAKVSPPAQPNDRDQWRQALTDVLPLLRSGNMEAITLLEGMALQTQHEEMQTLIAQAQGLAFADALFTAERLLEGT